MLIVMCPCRFTSYNKCTTLRGNVFFMCLFFSLVQMPMTAPFAEKNTIFALYRLCEKSLVMKTVIFPRVNGLGTFVKSHLTIYERVYFWTLYPVSLVFIPTFILVPHSFDYCNFTIKFETGSVGSSMDPPSI